MGRYFVVQTLTVMVDQGPDEELDATTDVRLVECEDTRAVCKALLEVRDADGGDWRLFERTPDGRMRSRAVVFKMDGKVPYDVEVS